MTIPCPDCARKFVDENALWQHRRYRHRLGTVVNPHPRVAGDDDDDDSYALIAIEAQRKQAAGEPLEPWEEAYRY